MPQDTAGFRSGPPLLVNDRATHGSGHQRIRRHLPTSLDPWRLEGLLGRHQPDVDTQRSNQGAKRSRRWVGLTALDPADLGLVDAGHLSELLLRQATAAPLLGELAGEREVQTERLELGNGLRSRAAGLGLELSDVRRMLR